jgi:hypothetical protein
MLVRDALHSLNASPLHADCSAVDGLNSANDGAGSIKRAKPKAAIILLWIVLIFFLPFHGLLMPLVPALCRRAKEAP